MRKGSLLAIMGAGCVVSLRFMAGCFDYANDCQLNGECCPDGTMACFSTTGTGGQGGGTGGEGGTGGMPSCAGEPSEVNITEACAVFVQADATGATSEGTREKPYKTLQEAIDKAGGKRVYACASAPFSEAVSVTAGVELVGGFDCANGWAWKADARSVLEGPADMIALFVESSADSVKVENFAISSASATKPGGSSLAVVVDKAALELTRCDLSAADGAEGVAGMPYASAGQVGAMGLTGGDACTANSIIGADPVNSMCGAMDSTSGNGGNGLTNSGGDGSDGLPVIAMNGGAGEGALACVAGSKGEDGIPGDPGSGATVPGKIDKTGPIVPAGNDGMPGAVAQGGGGGGGAKGGVAANKCPVGMGGGASGGSGGSGGCGGAGGKGGSAGGSSIALLSLDASLTFAGVTVTTGKGAKGGAGGLGQDGGQGGPSGAGGKVPMGSVLNPGCSGGPGGQGGKGGQGGGGLGGHAIGIAYTGAAAPSVKGATFSKGTPGEGGLGAGATGNGAPGVQADLQVFP